VKWTYGAVSLNMFLLRDFDTYKTLVCDRSTVLDAGLETVKLSYLQYAFKRFDAKTRSRNSFEPNVLDLLVAHQHKSLITTLPLVQGLLDHKWNTFARQLLTAWGIISLIMFVIFEINVYHTASQTGLAEFTALEWVGAALFASACASLIPVLQVQIIFAVAVMMATVWYQIDLGIPPFDESHEGTPVKYRIHSPQEFEEVELKRLVCADLPSWMMLDSERAHMGKLSKRMSELKADDDGQVKHYQDFNNILNEYKKLISGHTEDKNQLGRVTGKELPSFEQYLARGPTDDSYLDHRNFAILTRDGGKFTAAASQMRSRPRRLSMSAVQKQLKDGINQMMEIPGVLKTGFSQLMQGRDRGSLDAESNLRRQNKTLNWFEMVKFVMRFMFHVCIGGFFDGVNSMIQIWAVLIVTSAVIRALQIPDVEEINTAIMSVASVGFFLSFMFFYRVNAKFGPFIVILKEMTVEDLSKWLVLVVLFLAGTGQAMYIILDDPMAFLKPFKWMLGDTEQSSADSPIEDLM
jgi:hypothetical protein